MPVTSKVLARTAASTTVGTVLYTTPSTVTAIVTNIVVCNPSTSAITASVLLNDVDMLGSVSIAANSTFAFDLKQVLPANQTIKGSASATAVDFHISGVEIS